MTASRKSNLLGGHRIVFLAVLCLLGLSVFAAQKHRKAAKPADERIYLIHADELKFDMYGTNPDAQIVKGHVAFRHKGAHLTCDSAFFYQASNSVKAFGHVHFTQGDTLSLSCDHAFYDGQQQMMEARKNVWLHHRKQTLNTDSLNYDRLYNYAYFFEGGVLVDGKNRLKSDWGQYNLKSKEAVFYYSVELKNGKDHIYTDTLYYDTRKSMAHLLGPSRILSGKSTVKTTNGYYDTHSDRARLFGRSTVVDGDKTIVGDSLFYKKEGMSEGFGNVVYVDKKQKNTLHCGYLRYNEKTGYGYATKRVLVKDYSQKDTLYLHADTLKLYTYNINTDSVYRVGHAYPHVRAYRNDIQAVCDSLVFSSLDSCMTMYRDPIVWNANRQLLGERILVFMGDSTVREARVIGQALSIEQVDEKDHFNQISSRQMFAFFEEGNLRRSVATGNVRVIYFPQDDKDSSLIGLNYTETDSMRMYFSPQRQLLKIWSDKADNIIYPMTQIPPTRYKLDAFAWFDSIRPRTKDDIFVWRGKSEGEKLKKIERHAAPLQQLGSGGGAQ